MEATTPTLSLVIPCYNEGKSLPALIERLKSIFKSDEVEVILVDNGSKDDSPEILSRLLAGQNLIKSIRVDVNQGYGFGILTGLRITRGKYLGWTHADMQTDPNDALKALDLIKARNFPDKIYIKGKRYGRPITDVFFTIGMSFFETIYLRKTLWDINAQPNIFSRGFFESWNNPPHDFSLDLFAYFQAKQMAVPVVRIPVLFSKRLHGISHWNVDWKSKWKFIRRTLDFSTRLKSELSK